MIFAAIFTSVYALWIWLNFLKRTDVFKQIVFKNTLKLSVLGAILGGFLILIKYFFNQLDLLEFKNIYIHLGVRSLLLNGILNQTSIYLVFLFYYKKYKHEFKDSIHYFFYFNAIVLGAAASEMAFKLNNPEAFDLTFESCFVFLSQMFHGFFIIYYILRKQNFNQEWNNNGIVPWIMLSIFFRTFYTFFSELNLYEIGAIFIDYLYILVMSTFFNRLMNNVLNISKAFTYQHLYNPNKNIRFLFLHFFLLLLLETYINGFNSSFLYSYYLSVIEVFKTGFMLVILAFRLNSFRFESGKWCKFNFELPFYLKSYVNYETSNTSTSIAFKGDSYLEINLDNYIGTTLMIQSVSKRNNYLEEAYKIHVIEKFYVNNVQMHLKIQMIDHYNNNAIDEYVICPKIYGITEVGNQYPVVALLQEVENQSTKASADYEFLEWSYLSPIEE